MINPQSVFDQCHEHLRMIEQRRDLAVGVLLTLVLAVLAVLKNDDGQHWELKFAVTVIAIGIFVLLGVLRRWKLIHLHAASVFMRFSGDDLPTQEEVSAIWDRIVGKSSTKFRWSSIDLWSLLISALVSAVIAVPLLAELLELAGFEMELGYIFAVAIWILITVVTRRLTETKDHSFPDYAWMFRGLVKSRK